MWKPGAAPFLAGADARIRELNALASATGKAKDVALARLLAHTKTLRHVTTMFDLRPIDVQHYLMSLDSSARTRVHAQDCIQEGKCDCPKRAHASAITTHRNALSKAFAEGGLLSDWAPQSQTGNPVQSRLVRDYEAAINREQLLAGVTSKQAALFDYAAFDYLEETIRAAARAALAAGNLREAVANAMDMFLYAFMFYSGSRLADVINKTWKDVDMLVAADGSPAAWSVRRGKTKATQKVRQDSFQVIENDRKAWHMAQIVPVLKAICEAAGLDASEGCLFKKVAAGASASLCWSGSMSDGYANTRFDVWRATAKLPTGATLHSFHASRAVHLLNNGWAVERVRGFINWSEAMLLRYLDQPLFTSAEKVIQLNAAVAFGLKPATA